MAWQRNIKGGRSWFGKAEAKASGRVSRRQEDRAETTYEPLVEWNGLWLPQWKVDRIEEMQKAASRPTVTAHDENLALFAPIPAFAIGPDCGCGLGDGCQWDGEIPYPAG